MPMKNRFRLIRRGERHQFYCVDSETGQRHSLKTSDRDAAEQIVLAKNQALRQAPIRPVSPLRNATDFGPSMRSPFFCGIKSAV